MAENYIDGKLYANGVTKESVERYKEWLYGQYTQQDIIREVEWAYYYGLETFAQLLKDRPVRLRPTYQQAWDDIPKKGGMFYIEAQILREGERSRRLIAEGLLMRDPLHSGYRSATIAEVVARYRCGYQEACAILKAEGLLADER